MQARYALLHQGRLESGASMELLAPYASLMPAGVVGACVSQSAAGLIGVSGPTSCARPCM
jgi:hypothetical protein